jgi:hypothetical protein
MMIPAPPSFASLLNYRIHIYELEHPLPICSAGADNLLFAWLRFHLPMYKNWHLPFRKGKKIIASTIIDIFSCMPPTVQSFLKTFIFSLCLH